MSSLIGHDTLRIWLQICVSICTCIRTFVFKFVNVIGDDVIDGPGADARGRQH